MCELIAPEKVKPMCVGFRLPGFPAGLTCVSPKKDFQL